MKGSGVFYVILLILFISCMPGNTDKKTAREVSRLAKEIKQINEKVDYVRQKLVSEEKKLADFELKLDKKLKQINSEINALKKQIEKLSKIKREYKPPALSAPVKEDDFLIILKFKEGEELKYKWEAQTSFAPLDNDRKIFIKLAGLYKMQVQEMLMDRVLIKLIPEKIRLVKADLKDTQITLENVGAMIMEMKKTASFKINSLGKIWEIDRPLVCSTLLEGVAFLKGEKVSVGEEWLIHKKQHTVHGFLGYKRLKGELLVSVRFCKIVKKDKQRLAKISISGEMRAERQVKIGEEIKITMREDLLIDIDKGKIVLKETTIDVKTYTQKIRYLCETTLVGY